MNDRVNINKCLGLGGNGLVCAWLFSTTVISLFQPQVVSGWLPVCSIDMAERLWGFWTHIKFHRPTLGSLWQWGDIFASAHETQSSQCLTLFITSTRMVRMTWTSLRGQRDHLNSLVTHWIRAQGFLGFSVPGWQKYDNQDCSYRTKHACEKYSRYINLHLSCCGGPLQQVSNKHCIYKSSFYCMSKKNKNFSARRYTWCLYSQLWVQVSHQSHPKY